MDRYVWVCFASHYVHEQIRLMASQKENHVPCGAQTHDPEITSVPGVLTRQLYSHQYIKFISKDVLFIYKLSKLAVNVLSVFRIKNMQLRY